MKIIKTNQIPQLIREVKNGDVFRIIGDGECLFIAGEWGIGTKSNKRQATNLSDGSVVVLDQETKVSFVKGAFVLEE